MKWFILLGLVLSASAALVKRDAATSIFAPGKLFVYDFSLMSMAGSEDYVAFASTFNITGQIEISASGSNLNVRMKGIKFGAHNGKFDFKDLPKYSMKEYAQLKPLEQPFTVQLQGGKARGIVLNSNVDEWAHNIKRGIATALQMDLAKIDITKADNFAVEEDTVVGHCETDYIVIPGEDDNHAPLNKAQVRKFRSHARCADKPRRIRKPGVPVQLCADDHSRDVLNSTGYAVYDLEIKDGSLTAKKIHVGSTLIYNIFGVDGHTQYSYTDLNMILKESKSGSVPAPSSPKNYNDLKFEFENDLKEDEDIRSPQPFFFHHKGLDLDSAGQNRAADQLINNIKKIHESLENVAVFEDVAKFHKVSPFTLIPFIYAMDYQHIKDVYNKVKDGDETEKKLFLDTLAMSGTGPAVLVLRDIAAQTTDTVYIARMIGPLPNYIRNPTENLLKELEGLIKPDNSKANGRIIEFAFASLLGRTCKKNGCQKSGLLDKWVKYWSDKIDSGSSWDEKTQAVIALRNINLLPAAKKLLTVLEDHNQERSIRSAAMSGLAPLIKEDPKAFKKHVYPIFFDKQEDSELRNTALQWTLKVAPEENMFHEVAIFTWGETNPEIKNFAKTLFQGVAETTKPCLTHVGSWAKTALQMMTHHQPKGKYSGTYISDYHDPQYNFGHMSVMSVQKNGRSILPRTLFVGFYGETAGYNTNYLSVFIRLEGFGKALASRVMQMTTGILEFDDIKDVFSKIGVQSRQPDPLRVEIAVMLHGRVVGYHAADQKTITTIPALIKKIGEMRSASYEKELVRMMLLGGITTEQPNELGLPVSTVSGATALAAIHAKVGSGSAPTSRAYDIRLQFNVHGISSVNNHLTPFGTAHTVEAVRTMRIRLPRKVTVSLDMKNYAFNFAVSAPTEEDPVMAQMHATVVTAVHSDAPAAMRDNEIVDLLHETCPECKGMIMISKGEKYRTERRLGSGYKYKFMEGVSAGVKYFDCEKVHSRIHVLKQLRKYFGPENKNLGGRTGRALTTLRLGLRYMIHSLFFSPQTETCGMKLWYKRDTSAQSVFDKVEGQIRGKFEEDPKDKIGMRLQAKTALNFKYTGAVPKSKSVDLILSAAKTGWEKTELKAKLSVKDESAGKSGSVCIDVNAAAPKITDFFAYEGENEPTYERTINIAWSKDDKSKEVTCPPNSAGVKIVRKAYRSEAQKEEARNDVWPYKQCNEVKNSPKYPGPMTPATEACVWAAFKQTNLRQSNVTITYKVDKDARQRWRYPGALLAAMLMPYWVPADTVEGHAAHGHAEHGVTADGHLQGELMLDVTMDEDEPQADIHWHGSGGEEEHFHGVDLNFLPGPFKRPLHSRFPGFTKTLFDLGIYGYCDVTPHAIQTFDNSTYYADLSECHTLIAGDCAEKPMFAVLGKKISNDKLGLKMFIGEHKVEMNDLNNVIIDGKSHPLSEKVLRNEGDAKIFKIYKHDVNNVFLMSQKLALTIRYTGHYTTVSLGSRFRGTQCGLCGNFDGCPKNDFTGPEATCKNIRPDDMTKAFIYRDGSCAGVGNACPRS